MGDLEIGFVLHNHSFLIDPFFLQILLDTDLHGVNTDMNLSKLRGDGVWAFHNKAEIARLGRKRFSNLDTGFS